MIIVLGSVTAADGKVDEALGLSQVHVARSRTEPGCLAHAVHIDTESPNRLVFTEKWADMATLQDHFKVPESRAFGKALAALAAVPPTIELYDSTVIPLK